MDEALYVLQVFNLHYKSGKPDAMEQALKKLCEDVERAVTNGLEIIVLSDKISKEDMDIERPPIPTLLAVGAVHHHLIRRVLQFSFGMLLAQRGHGKRGHCHQKWTLKLRTNTFQLLFCWLVSSKSLRHNGPAKSAEAALCIPLI